MKNKSLKIFIMVVFLFLGAFKVKAISLPSIATIKLTVNAVDSNGKAIDGAEYSITKEDPKVWINKSSGEPANNNRLMEQSSASTKVFGNTVSRGSFETVSFVDNLNISSDAIDSWDVSVAQNESVMAWYTDTDSNGKFELYIGQEGGVILQSGADLFYDFNNIKTVNGLDKLNTSQVTTMESMFENCMSLKELDFSRLNTKSFITSEVTNMSNMFFGCKSLELLDVTSFDTSNVTSMSYMFYDCSSVTALDLNNFDTSKVINMARMFGNCNDLYQLDISSFNTSTVTSMMGMFEDCQSLYQLDLTNFHTSLVSDDVEESGRLGMAYMFKNCENLVELDISSFDVSKISHYTEMFSGCVQLNHIYVSDLWKIITTLESTNMFENCEYLPNYNANTVNASKANYESGGYLTYKPISEPITTLKGLEFELMPGTYTLKETKTPSGYSANERSYSIFITNTDLGIVYSEGSSDHELTINRDPSDFNTSIFAIKYNKMSSSTSIEKTENTTKIEEKVENPATGVAVPLASLTALSGLGFVIYKYSKKKNLFN